LREDINNNQLLDDNHAEKGNREQLKTNPYDCATNNDSHAKERNKESLETDLFDCATDNGKLLED